ncbi:DUF2182 domain-containing protein [Halobacteria archaeon HArc-gm2]|nr:DUF2182 domain-containing protein [Halobacteria archaeon HArc-gm2]
MQLDHSRSLDRLERRLDSVQIPPVTLGVLAVTLSLWVALLAGWVPMPMPADLPMSAPGAMERAALHGGAIGTYLVMWGVMMAAMMYPAMLPFARRYASAMEGDWPARAAALATFFATYGLVWTATGAVPLAVDAIVDVHALVVNAPELVYGSTLVFVGWYQLSGFKGAALDDCCDRVSVDSPALRTAAGLGLRHGRNCVLATWHLFALMVLVGSMNHFWMLGLTGILVTERFPVCGREISRAVGLLAAVAGVLILLPVPFPFL